MARGAQRIALQGCGTEWPLHPHPPSGRGNACTDKATRECFLQCVDSAPNASRQCSAKRADIIPHVAVDAIPSGVPATAIQSEAPGLASQAMSRSVTYQGASFRLKSGQVRSGQARTGQVRPGQVRTGQVRSEQIRSDQVRSAQLRSGQLRSVAAEKQLRILNTPPSKRN